jgi:2-polyprenyl-3-methyl-5-hydroxy-6-metoxy-1,4-benzoquinol methylase
MRVIFKDDLERIRKKVWKNKSPFPIKRKKSGLGENKTTEMSDYFNYVQYDRATRAHAFYQEMINGMIFYLSDRIKKAKKPLKILEIGCGNGSLTDRLVELPSIKILATDVDKNSIKFVKGRLKSKNLKVARANALRIRSKEPFDIVIASWNYEHITNYKNGSRLGKSVSANLKNDGIYIEGAELVGPFTNEKERQITFLNYHEDIIDRALKAGNQDTAEIEYGALVSGLIKVSHFKRDKDTHIKELEKGGLKLITWKKFGPFTKKVGTAGNYFFVFKKK